MTAPDVVLLEGVLDDSGVADEGATTADTTFGQLVAAVRAAGGPVYQYVQIEPADNEDGGIAGANARLGFLYNPARVVLDINPGGAALATAVACVQGKAGITYNPGRVDPNRPIRAGYRKPLALHMWFNGYSLFILGIDLASHAADSPLYGATQPPTRPSDIWRHAQASTEADFVQQILNCEPQGHVLVLGNANDTLGAGALAPLYEGGMGNPAYDVVHVNAEFATRTSDHDPILANFSLPVQFGVASKAFLPIVGR